MKGADLLDFWKSLRNLYECARVSFSIGVRLNHECCGSTSCCSFLRERERVHLSPHIPSDPAFARWAPVWLAPMAPPLRRQSEFQEFAFDAIDYKTVFSSLIGSKQPTCQLNGSLLMKMCLDSVANLIFTNVTFSIQMLWSIAAVLQQYCSNLINMMIFNTSMYSS